MAQHKTRISIGKYNKRLIKPADEACPESRLFRISRFNRNWMFTLFIPPAALPFSLIGDEYGFADRFFWMQLLCSLLQIVFWAVILSEMYETDVRMLCSDDLVGQNREVDKNRQYLIAALSFTILSALMIMLYSGFERFWCPLFSIQFCSIMFASGWYDSIAVRHLNWDKDVLRPADITDKDMASLGFSDEDFDDVTLVDDNYYYRQQSGRSNADVNAPFERFARADDAYHDWACGHEDLDSGNHRDCR